MTRRPGALAIALLAAACSREAPPPAAGAETAPAAETQKGAEENARSVAITTDETRAMEPGSWTLEIWLGGDKVDERAIEITKGVSGV